MLPPEYFDTAAEDMEELVGKFEQAVTRDIVRRLVKTGGITDTARWQIQCLQASGVVYEDILQHVAELSGESASVIREIFEDAGVKATSYDNAIYEAAGLTPIPLKQSPAAWSTILAGIEKTAGHLNNLSLTTASTTQTAYIQAVNMAVMQVESGALDYITAIRQAVQNAAKDGLSVLYPTGHKSALDVATRRAVLTGVSQTMGKVSERYADEMGCDLVEVTAHAGARPSHAAWQGKVYSRSGTHPLYPDFVQATGYGTGPGLKGWGCRHDFFPFFEGLSVSAYPRELLDEYNNRTVTYNDKTMSYYDATQKQRAMERAVRASKKELAGYGEAVKAADNEALRYALKEDFDSASVKLKRQESVLKDFLQQTDMIRQNEREQVLGFGRSQAGKARAAAEKTYQQWVKSIGASGSAPKTLANYYTEKYNNSPAYQLLTGYSKAVQKGSISPLVGLEYYQQVAAQISQELVGITTATGVKIESYATHFIDRVIGQTDNSHPGLRQGVTIAAVKNALKSPGKQGVVRTMADGDVRQAFYSTDATVTISIRDKRLIQTNPRTR